VLPDGSRETLPVTDVRSSAGVAVDAAKVRKQAPGRQKGKRR
jgi:hypothetical protein